MLKKHFKIILSIIIVVLLSLCGARLFLHYNHWSMRVIDDKDLRPLGYKVSLIKEGLPIATKRALEWRKDAVLSYIVMRVEGKEAIRNKYGIITYEYFVRNSEAVGMPHVIGYVEIDIEKQAIVRFYTLSGERLEQEPLDYSAWKIDINDIYDEIYVKEYAAILDKFSNPTLAIRTSKDIWEAAVFSSPESKVEEITIAFDATTGEVKRARKKEE